MRTLPLLVTLAVVAVVPLAGQTPAPAPTPTPSVAPIPAPVTADSGIVRPGMTEAAVQAAWGAPSGSRVRGDYKYLFFANNCQPACGIQDVVMLERGQVVDAIARDPRHRYAGVSSSPAGRTPSATISTPTGSPSR
jgi:hypothetical protein